MTARFYPLGPCPACGDHIDYCQGHGELGDTWGYNVLILHDDGNHSRCHPASDCRNDDPNIDDEPPYGSFPEER